MYSPPFNILHDGDCLVNKIGAVHFILLPGDMEEFNKAL